VFSIDRHTYLGSFPATRAGTPARTRSHISLVIGIRKHILLLTSEGGERVARALAARQSGVEFVGEIAHVSVTVEIKRAKRTMSISI
jgi:hypothetical protein